MLPRAGAGHLLRAAGQRVLSEENAGRPTGPAPPAPGAPPHHPHRRSRCCRVSRNDTDMVLYKT